MLFFNSDAHQKPITGKLEGVAFQVGSLSLPGLFQALGGFSLRLFHHKDLSFFCQGRGSAGRRYFLADSIRPKKAGCAERCVPNNYESLSRPKEKMTGLPGAVLDRP